MQAEKAKNDICPAGPILDVYLAAAEVFAGAGPVTPPEREAWIGKAAQARVRAQRRAVWKLLELGIARSFGLDMEELSFSEKNGRWTCGRLCFSLSHSGSVAAAAVSDGAVGVDVESIAAFAARDWDSRKLKRAAERVRAGSEEQAVNGPEDFLRLWTRKESIFKCSGEGSLLSRKPDTAAHSTLTFALEAPEPCVLSVCGERLAHVRLWLVDDAGVFALPPPAMSETDTARS